MKLCLDLKKNVGIFCNYCCSNILCSPQEFTHVSTVRSRRAPYVAATFPTVASSTTRHASALTPLLYLTTRASAAHSTPAWAATMAAAPSTNPPRVRLHMSNLSRTSVQSISLFIYLFFNIYIIILRLLHFSFLFLAC